MIMQAVSNTFERVVTVNYRNVIKFYVCVVTVKYRNRNNYADCDQIPLNVSSRLSIGTETHNYAGCGQIGIPTS